MLPRRLAALLVTMALPVAPAASSERAQTSSIKGLVYAEDGYFGLPAVPIELGREGRPGFKIVGVTEFRGLYAFRGLEAADDYVLSLDCPGFTSVVVGPLEVSEGATVRQDVTLRSTASETSVDEPEQQLYQDAEKRIVETIRTADTPTIGFVMRALLEIENIPDVLQEDDRDGLRYTVEEVLGTIAEPGDPFILDLLRDPDPDIQSMAIHLLNQDSSAWLQDPEVRALLEQLVESRVGDAAVATGILWAYAYAGRFDEVRPAALALARGGEFELARDVASVIAWSHEQAKDVVGLRQLFQESDGLLRQETAIWLAESFEEWLAPDERTQVAWELVRTMGDPSLSPDFRGDAIRAAGRLSNEPIVDNALLGLLEPDMWFGGVPDPPGLVPGHPRPSHSLTAVLGSLDARPGIAGDLLKLKGRLDLLEDEYRSDVEGSIDETLSKLSVIVD